jgi:tRNA U55 pseudouridine synthase TruB
LFDKVPTKFSFVVTQLFQWAREKQLHQITIPTKNVQIFSMKLESMSKITIDDLESWVTSRIERVNGGDFRQEQILAEWRELFRELRNTDVHYQIDVLTFHTNVSHGTYIRLVFSILLIITEISFIFYFFTLSVYQFFCIVGPSLMRLERNSELMLQ